MPAYQTENLQLTQQITSIRFKNFISGSIYFAYSKSEQNLKISPL